MADFLGHDGWSWDDLSFVLDTTQAALDAVGVIPGLGEVADGLNGLISLGRRDCVGAGLSFVSMVPIFGDIVGKGGKITRYAVKYSDEAAVAMKELDNGASRIWSQTVVAPTGNAFAQRLPGTVVDLSGDVFLTQGRQHARALALVQEAAPMAGIKNLGDYVDDVVFVSRNVYGDEMSPFFSVINGRRTLGITGDTLARPKAGQLLDALHELNHARHNRLLGEARYDVLYDDLVQHARIEVLVQNRAIRQLQKAGIDAGDAILRREYGYVDYWSREYFDPLFGLRP